MTRKEQNKISNDKIEANNAQYNLDRMNAEISAYSSGELSKYEYLTNKDLGYKPDAFEQAKFEYSPLGKVFTDALNKSDRKEGLLKRLKNIEDKSNNQLLALRDINRLAIKGRNGNGNGNNDDDDENYDDEYKKIQKFKKDLLDKKILALGKGKDKDKANIYVNNIFSKWKETKNEDIVYINNTDKIDTKKFDIYEIFDGYLNKKISYKEIEEVIDNIKRAIELYQRKLKYSDKNKSVITNSNKVINGIESIKSLINKDNFRIPGEYYDKPSSSTDLSWINDDAGYEKIAEEAGGKFMKRKNDNELKLIKDFITKINNGTINNKNKAGN